MLGQHKFFWKFCVQLHVGQVVLLPQHRLTQVLMAHVLHSHVRINQSSSRSCAHSETCFDLEIYDLSIVAEIVLQTFCYFHCTNLKKVYAGLCTFFKY
jgi:hypothetical protein